MKRCVWFGLLAVLALMTACTGGPAADAGDAAVRSLLDRFTQAYRAKDMDLFEKIFSHDADMVNFGTDADEYWIGWPPWKDAFRRQFDSFESIEIAFNDVRTKTHFSGEVAWFSAMMTVDIVSSGKAYHYEGMRVTGVAEKRGRDWVYVQRHVSLPVQGRAVEYK